MESINYFEPKGENPMWQILYEATKDLDIGYFLSWEKLHSLTGFDIEHKDRGLVYQTNKHLLKNHQKMLLNKRKQGYIIAEAKEQLSHGMGRRNRGRRQFDKGVLELNYCNTNRLSPEEKTMRIHFINHLQSLIKVARKRNFEAVQKGKAAVKAQESSLSKIDLMMGELTEMKKGLKS